MRRLGKILMGAFIVALVLMTFVGIPYALGEITASIYRRITGTRLPGGFKVLAGFGGFVLGLVLWPLLTRLLGRVVTFLLRFGQHPMRSLRAATGRGLPVAELARRLDLTEADLHGHVPGYRTTKIPKRRGGTRTLSIPDKQTAMLQRRILHRLLRNLRAHPAAHAYERGRSIATNAAPHVGRQVVLKMDLRDFFPATTAARVEKYFRFIGWNAESARLLTSFVCHDGGLPQGAPTSPRLANLVNFGLDHAIDRHVQGFRGSYTRYADDITVSFPEDWPMHVRSIALHVRRIARRHGYRVHGVPKMGVYRPHQRQQVCGVVVNRKPALPRERRRWLRAVQHRIETGGAATLTPSQLQGWLAYRQMIETVAVPPAPPERKRRRRSWRRKSE